MKRTLIELDKKDFTTEIGGKKVINMGGAYYCSKCGYRMHPEVKLEGKGKFQRAEFFMDISCLCDAK